MYAVHRQAHTPTAVEFSVHCNFISSKEKNLVVAGTSQLFVYRIIHDVEVFVQHCHQFFKPKQKASPEMLFVFVSEFIKV